MKVISRSSVIQYKKTDARNLREIGKTLGVAYVVEGSVQRAGNRIKVTAQLIDARTDAGPSVDPGANCPPTVVIAGGWGPNASAVVAGCAPPRETLR